MMMTSLPDLISPDISPAETSVKLHAHCRWPALRTCAHT